MGVGGVAPEFVLYSEHKRVLGDAIKRGDDRAKAEFRRGLVHTVWIAGFAALGALIVGVNVGLRLVQ